jgi:hypothetical protein
LSQASSNYVLLLIICIKSFSAIDTIFSVKNEVFPPILFKIDAKSLINSYKMLLFQQFFLVDKATN